MASAKVMSQVKSNKKASNLGETTQSARQPGEIREV